MAVPEAAINKYYSIITPQNDVRLSRKAWIVDSITEARFVQLFSDYDFRLCILSPNACHHTTSSLSCHNICHKQVVLLDSGSDVAPTSLTKV